MLVNILIFLFFLLILYQFLHSCQFKNKEGLENSAGSYQNYPDDPLILGKQNAGNIEVLKKEVEEIPEMKRRIDKLEEDVKIMTDQLQGIQEQNATAVSSFSETQNMLTSPDGENSDITDSTGTSTSSSSYMPSMGGTS
jgi:TolA-binding protein